MAPPKWAYQVEHCVNEPDEELLCNICLSVFCDPVVCPCDHVFCGKCISTWLQNNQKCPICRMPASSSSIKKVVPIIKNLVMKLRLNCHNKNLGCKAQFSLENSESHIKECKYEPSVSVNTSAMQSTTCQGDYGHQRMPTNPYMINGMSATMDNPMVNCMNSMSNHMSSYTIANCVSPMSSMGMNFNAMNRSMPVVDGEVWSNGFFPSMHRNRVTPYATCQQHMVQKMLAKYNPATVRTVQVQQYGPTPGMQNYGGGTQQSLNSTQYPGGPGNQFSKQQQYNPSVQQPPMDTRENLQQQVGPSIRSQSNSRVNPGGQYMQRVPIAYCYNPQYNPQQPMQQNLSYQPIPIPGHSAPSLSLAHYNQLNPIPGHPAPSLTSAHGNQLNPIPGHPAPSLTPAHGQLQDQTLKIDVSMSVPISHA